MADADVTISSAATQNMACSAGTCLPTAKNAVLNVGDLESLLASGDVTVKTTGSNVEAGDLDIASALSWSNSSNLALAAKGAINVSAGVASEGGGGMNLSSSKRTADGPLYFAAGGSISFADTSSPLVINGASYVLVDGIGGLANALATNASGSYALAANYDAGKDKPFKTTPIPSGVAGTVEGLGNKISNIHIAAKHVQDVAGLLSAVTATGAVRNLRISALQMRVGVYQLVSVQTAGGLVNSNAGLLFDDGVTGGISVDATQSASGSFVGGIVAQNTGTLEYCNSGIAIVTKQTDAGGVAGSNSGSISHSFATGKVTSNSRVPFIEIGGLVAYNAGDVSNTFATGDVRGSGTLEDDGAPTAGGLIGMSVGNVADSYSTGRVMLVSGYSGGFAGDISDCSHCYWDTSTSKTAKGAGEGKLTGLTGKTSHQLRMGLPRGFNARNWTEVKGINRGLPFLKKDPAPG
jgi:hypothetical protein